MCFIFIEGTVCVVRTLQAPAILTFFCSVSSISPAGAGIIS